MRTATASTIILQAKKVIPAFSAITPSFSGILSRQKPPKYDPAADPTIMTSMIFQCRKKGNPATMKAKTFRPCRTLICIA